MFRSHLCSFIPYPNTNLDGSLPLIFYFSPVIALAIPGIPLYLSYKAGENYFRVTLFGFAYYFFNVVFILQFVSAGATIMSERYSYAPYLGIAFMVVYYLFVVMDKWPAFKMPVILLALGASGALAYLCYDRTKVWHNTKTFVARCYCKISTPYSNFL